MRYFKRSSGQAVTVKDGAESVEVELDPGYLELPGANLTADIYAHDDRRHPDAHLGWWTFDVAGAANPLRLTFDLHAEPGDVTVRAAAGEPGAALPLAKSWVNPDYPLHPIQDIDLVARDGSQEKELLRFTCFVRDTGLLSAYYSREEHQETAYSTANLVLEEFHAHRLRVFTRLFERHIPAGSRVLDVGSGYSLIRCCRTAWPFEVTCCDLDEAAMRKMAEDAPEYRWVLSDAADLPFADAEFDAVFAGEIIEHLPDPRAGFREWLRVLKPGGVIILSTPNRRRLMNALNRADDPVNPEHISEMTYRELGEMLRGEGLTVLHREGIYMEWLFNYFRKGPWIDLLPTYCQKRRWRPVVRATMYSGRFFRPWAQNLVFVARKP